MASSITQTQEELGSSRVLTRSQSKKRNESDLAVEPELKSPGANMGLVNGKRPRPSKAFTTREAEWKAAVPKDVPSILELKKTLPAHCFSPSLLRSYYYVLKDFVIIAALYAAMLFVERSWSVPNFVKYAVTPLYWYLQVNIFVTIVDPEKRLLLLALEKSVIKTNMDWTLFMIRSAEIFTVDCDKNPVN